MIAELLPELVTGGPKQTTERRFSSNIVPDLNHQSVLGGYQLHLCNVFVLSVCSLPSMIKVTLQPRHPAPALLIAGRQINDGMSELWNWQTEGGVKGRRDYQLSVQSPAGCVIGGEETARPFCLLPVGLKTLCFSSLSRTLGGL